MKQKYFINSRELYQYSLNLAKQIYNSDYKPGVIISVYRGGVFPGIVIQDYLKSKGINTFHFPLACQSYDENKAESISKEVKVFDLPRYAATTINKWKNILVVDDILDSGKTLEKIRSTLYSYIPGLCYDYFLQNFKSACLFWKPLNSKIRPDWYVKEITDQWLVFPHEFVGLTEDELQAKMLHENEMNS